MGAQSNRQEQISKAPHKFLKEPFLFGHWRDQKAAATAGGTFTQDAWQTRVLQTEKTNEITGASLASNQVTLPPGKYLIWARAVANSVNSHRLRVRDTTGSADLALSESSEADATAAVQSAAVIPPQPVTLSVASVIELQHYCQTTKATDGFGVASNLDSQVEVYAELFVQKLS